MADNQTNIVDNAKASIKKNFTSYPWWSLVRNHVKKNLLYVINNINPLGPYFNNAFLSIACALNGL